MPLKRKSTEAEIKAHQDVLNDKTRSSSDRKAAYDLIRDEMMNPFLPAGFATNTFDPMEGVRNHDIIKRQRILPQRRLPNVNNLQPKEIMDGQMVGMFESKQDLYLLIAALSERISDLEDTINNP